MRRTPSRLTQFTIDAIDGLHGITKHSNTLVRVSGKVLYRVANKFVMPRVGANHTVDRQLYGRLMRMPAEHPLPNVLHRFPQYNRPLALAASVLSSHPGDERLVVIDVGANIGETVAAIEQRTQNGLFLCIEAEQDLAQLCRFNHQGNSRVQTEQCFIGDQEGALVQLQDDGRANPSTKLIEEDSLEENGHYGRLVRLDTIAAPFVETNKGVSLIKVDTEGYDFSVLRSGAALIGRYKPALYFEWFPDLLINLHEQVWDGFDDLESLGYHYFVFFTSQGDYYCHLSRPDHFTLKSLAGAASRNENLLYFDVFASTDEGVCKSLVELALTQ